MSKIFKRPMFRKGGDVGGGIMDNVVERRQYANSNADDFSSLSDRVKFIEGLGGGDSRLDDPLTKFLLEIGPQIAGQTGGGGTIGNLLLASKEPTANLFKDISDKKRARQAIGLELFKDMDEDTATQFIKKAKQISQQVFNGTDPQEQIKSDILKMQLGDAIRKYYVEELTEANRHRQNTIKNIKAIFKVWIFRDTYDKTKFDWGSFGDDAIYKFLSANCIRWNNKFGCYISERMDTIYSITIN